MTADAGNTAQRSAAQVADLAARLGALGADAAASRELEGAAARAIVAATGAVEVAIFGTDEPPSTAQLVPRLMLLGAAQRPGEAPDVERTRRMRAAAEAACVAEAEALRHSDSVESEADAPWVYVAQPLDLPDGAVVVVVATAPEDAATLRATLAGSAGTLALLLRAATAERALASAPNALAQARAIFQHSSDAIMMVGEDYRVAAANPALVDLLHRSDTSVEGRRCHEVLACQDERGETLCDTLGCPLTQALADPPSSPSLDLLWRTGDGTRRFVSASFVGVPVNGGRRAVIVARDSTPMKTANRMRSNFISMVSHELRTPLNSLNGFLEIVLEGQAGPLRPRQEEFLNYARTSTHALMRLVEDIVFISRADTGQFTLRRDLTDVAEVVAPVLRAHELAAQRAGLDLRAEIPAGLPLICVDESRIQQVLHNLVMNALKFTPAPGAVVISAAAEPSALGFAVRDSGPGVAPEDRVRIFERFYQSEGAAKGSAAGYGLGLAIAKLIVEQHGGRIWVESSPGAGATFAFTVPLVDEGAPCSPGEDGTGMPQQTH
jgi:two-component system phosphate regulon sensor histidine kinase PhoR